MLLEIFTMKPHTELQPQLVFPATLNSVGFTSFSTDELTAMLPRKSVYLINRIKLLKKHSIYIAKGNLIQIFF